MNTNRLPGRWIAGLVVATAGLSAVTLLSMQGSDTVQVSGPPAPERSLLVYATPTGTPPFGGPRAIYRAATDGAHPVRLTAGNDPVISPDGRWIAFWRTIRRGSDGLYVLSTRGGHPRQLAAAADDAVTWSRDSRFIVSGGVGRVAVVDVRRGSVRRFTVPTNSIGYTFSPDGGTLAFAVHTTTGEDIFSLDLRDGGVHRLTVDGRSDAPLWGPRGIAFARSVTGGRGDVWLMTGTGADAHQLTHTGAGIYPVAWSVSGDRMLAAVPAMHNGRLYGVDVPAGRARALTPFVGDLYGQALSRDGRTVLAAIGCGGLASPYGVVETVPFAGGTPHVIVRGPCRASWTA